jgi:hypothetical protein
LHLGEIIWMDKASTSQRQLRREVVDFEEGR